jgi:hypothetical protein
MRKGIEPALISERPLSACRTSDQSTAAGPASRSHNRAREFMWSNSDVQRNDDWSAGRRGLPLLLLW